MAEKNNTKKMITFERFSQHWDTIVDSPISSNENDLIDMVGMSDHLAYTIVQSSKDGICLALEDNLS